MQTLVCEACLFQLSQATSWRSHYQVVWAVGDEVEYNSKSQKMLVVSKIVHIDDDGEHADLNCKHNTRVSPLRKVQQGAVAAVVQMEAEPGQEVLTVIVAELGAGRRAWPTGARFAGPSRPLRRLLGGYRHAPRRCFANALG